MNNSTGLMRFVSTVANANRQSYTAEPANRIHVSLTQFRKERGWRGKSGSSSFSLRSKFESCSESLPHPGLGDLRSLADRSAHVLRRFLGLPTRRGLPRGAAQTKTNHGTIPRQILEKQGMKNVSLSPLPASDAE